MRLKYLIIFSAGVVFALIFNSCKKEKNRICELYDGPVDYAIGTIDKLKSIPGKVTYVYSFKVNGQSYDGMEKAYGIGQKDKTLIDKRFVVVFAKDNISNNDLNTDFLIDTEADFEKFRTDHQNGPPPPDFPNKCD